MTLTNDPILSPTPEDSHLAQESSRILAPLARSKSPSSLSLHISSRKGSRQESITLPRAALKLLLQILNEMGKGNAVTLVPIHAQLTTQQAADLLGVSRPFISKELREGKIPFHSVGTHRRILFKDLMAYKQKCNQSHDQAMNDLVSQAQELNMGY